MQLVQQKDFLKQWFRERWPVIVVVLAITFVLSNMHSGFLQIFGLSATAAQPTQDENNTLIETTAVTVIEDHSLDPTSAFNYSFNLSNNTTANFAPKELQQPGFVITNDSSDHQLKFILNQSETEQVSQTAQPEVTDNSITFPVTLEGGITAKLRYTLSDSQVKEEFIISEKPSHQILQNLRDALIITFDVSLTDMTQSQENDQYLFTSDDGSVVWKLQAPTVIDSTGTAGEVSGSLIGTAYSLRLPSDYLRTATYPVVIDPTVTIGSSSTIDATQASTMRHLVTTSEGTLHAFVQMGTDTITCGDVGLWRLYSIDSGANWTCGDQLSASTGAYSTRYADARVDVSDNIYVVYSSFNGNTHVDQDVFYRKFTKGDGSSWAMGTEQLVLDGTNLDGYSFATLELDGLSRIWIAARYNDGSRRRTPVYYSDSLGVAPNWSLSKSDLIESNTGGNAVGINTIVRFGTKIGVLYVDSSAWMKWRYRDDSDGVTTWSAETQVSTASNMQGSSFSAIGDSAGHVFYAHGHNNTSYGYSVWNGFTWSNLATFTTTAANGWNISITTDGTNAWLLYSDTNGLSSGLSGRRKLVYKKCSPPYTTYDCDVDPTPVVSYHGTFDKYWSYFSAAYTDDTTDAANSTTADSQMIATTGDSVYFGKTEKFDAISWDVSTAGVGGTVTWEYCSAVDATPECTVWNALSFSASSNTNFTGDGWGSIVVPADWQAAKVNAEGIAFYYLRARATADYSSPPLGDMFVTIPQISGANITSLVGSNTTHAVWTENALSPTSIRYASFTTIASPTPAATAEISPTVMAYSSTTLATQPSTMKNIVRTSDGTLHAFVQAGTQAACGAAQGSVPGLVWLYSTDTGATWICGGQLSSDTTNMVYADARADTSDNLYVVYSMFTSGAGTQRDVSYRQLTKGAGATWTVEAEQTVLDGTASVGYHYPSIELEGTTRIWLAARYYDGINHQVAVYYSDGLSAAPSWNQSVATLDTADTSTSRHYSTMVRFGSKIGVIYVGDSTSDLLFRSRNDSDGLTTWSSQVTVDPNIDPSSPSFSAVGDASGNIYVVANDSMAVELSHYNGSSWSPYATVAALATNQQFSAIETDGTDVWVLYGDHTGLSSSQVGYSKLVYKKCTPPFASSNCDTQATQVVARQGTFDKYWSYVSGAYTDDTADAANTTNADTQMLTGVNDSAYFGKTEKFDVVSWDLTTAGDSAGKIAWEYWNGTSWRQLIDFYGATSSTFTTGNGYVSFIPPTDWTTTSVNGEGSAYYYVRARVTTVYSTPPVADQFATMAEISGANLAITQAGAYALWTENSWGSPVRIRYATVVTHNTAPNTPSSLGSSSLVDGSWGADTTPSFSFTLSDPDVADTDKYNIQIDDSANFGSPVVDYTSALAAQGVSTFTVGQAAGSGSYTTGAEAQTLSDTSYYWRVKAIDDDNVESSFTTANSGAVAFRVDATAPSAPGTPSTTSPTGDTTPSWSWTASTDTASGLAATPYTVQWCQDSGFSGCDGNTDTSSTNSYTHSTALSDGTWYLRAKATDALGTESSYSSAGAVSINTSSPTGSLSLNLGVAYTTTTAISLLIAAVDDVDPTSSMTMQVSNLFDLSDASYESYAPTKDWTLLEGDGTKTVYIRFKDAVGNESGIHSDTIIVDTTAPTNLELVEPGDFTYTTAERPSFKWKATDDITSSLSKYIVQVDNPSAGSAEPAGDFTIDDIPVSGTTDYVTNKYVVRYENFSDSDSANNYLSLYTRSTNDWNSDQNDGKLRQGRVRWTVKAVDQANNETSASRTVFVDTTKPNLSITQLNAEPVNGLYFSTNDQTPTIFGTITDQLAGGDLSQSQNDDGPKIASGPKQVEIKIEKQSGLLYSLETIYTINIDPALYSCDNTAITDSSKQHCDKYARFEYTPTQNLELGTYRVTISGSDNADNAAFEAILYLHLKSLAQLTTPDELAAIEEQIKTAPAEQQPQLVEELAVTKPQPQNLIQKLIDEISSGGAQFFSLISDVSGTFMNGVSIEIQSAFQVVVRQVENTLAFVGASFTQLASSFRNIHPPSVRIPELGIPSIAQTIKTVYMQEVAIIDELQSAIIFELRNTEFSEVRLGVSTATSSLGSAAQAATSAVTGGTQNVMQSTATLFMQYGPHFLTGPTRITEVKAVVLSPTSAKVTWTTNHPANGKVNWGYEDGVYDFETQTDRYTIRHEFVLTNLQPGTQYHYEVMSHNGNYVYDANRKFKTPAAE